MHYSYIFHNNHKRQALHYLIFTEKETKAQHSESCHSPISNFTMFHCPNSNSFQDVKQMDDLNIGISIEKMNDSNDWIF